MWVSTSGRAAVCPSPPPAGRARIHSSVETRARGGAELKEREEGRTKKDAQGQQGETVGNGGERRAGPGRGWGEKVGIAREWD